VDRSFKLKPLEEVNVDTIFFIDFYYCPVCTQYITANYLRDLYESGKLFFRVYDAPDEKIFVVPACPDCKEPLIC